MNTAARTAAATIAQILEDSESIETAIAALRDLIAATDSAPVQSAAARLIAVYAESGADPDGEAESALGDALSAAGLL